ncbi:hypothetical protein BASA83_008136 [Batrachochytrium salamandrivorans]|nr:hypothetical protein BASA83_008136 [Batrachochytrium salamandrivorans]
MIVRSLLANELKDTKSVMYELRGNSGGSVRFANSMVQLFKPDFQPFGNRYLMNQITFNIFVQGKDPNAYVRPMGVFNDGRCYSTCEVFSGSIQGHGAGTIFGEDKRTGGGGAIVKELDPTLVRASPVDFKKFPFSQELTSGSTTYANTLSVGITQAVRTGRYNGQLIEDVGIKTDTIFRPQWSDLQPNPTTNTQYDRIAESLARTGQKNGQSKLHFVCEPFSIEKPINGFSLEVEAAGIEEFTVFQADGKTIAAKKRSRAITKQKFSIPVSTAGGALGNNRITIVGKTAGKQVLKTIRNVRTIPTNDNYMKIGTPGKIDSSIEAFFTAPVGTEINIGIDATLDTEPGCDFLYLSVKSSGDVEDFLLSSKSRDGTKTFNGVSEREKIVRETIFFTTKSEKFSVSLRFTSDELFEFAGVRINSFTVSAA